MKLCQSKLCQTLVFSAIVAVAAGPARLEAGTTGVDLALVLAVDVSLSMNANEQQAQRSGYVNAFRNRHVIEAIASGPRGRIAVAYVEWSGPAYQQLRVPWTVISGPDDAAAFAAGLENLTLAAGTGTSLSGGLAFAAHLLASPLVSADRKVVDMSGDGPNNAGFAVEPVRDALVESGITINGLAISLPHDGEPDTADSFGPGYIAAYYEDCVIGGPGAFVIEVDDVAKFENSIRQKLILEIAAQPSRLFRAAYRPLARHRVDCLTIGERPGR